MDAYSLDLLNGGSSSNALNSLAYAGAGGVVLIVLGIIAWIVLTIILYVKYVSKNGDHRSRMGAFLNFDVLLIEKLLKFFYILNAVAITVGCVLLPILLAMTYGAVSGVGAGFLGFFIGLLIAALAFIILQLFNRVEYEFVLMFVILVQNTTAIRKAMVGDTASAGVNDPRAAGTWTNQPAPGAPVYGAAPAGGNWTCPVCGTHVANGNFCPKCGSTRTAR